MADVVLTGVREMVAKLNAKPRLVREACAKGLHSFGNKIMAESRQTYVPVLTGALKASGKVGQPDRMGDSVSVKLSYGGAAAPYAIYVHEITRYHHPHGQAKYLETPLKLYGTQAAVNVYLAGPIKEALEHGAAR